MVFGAQLYDGRGGHASIRAHALITGKWSYRTVDISHPKLERLDRGNVLSLSGFHIVIFQHNDY